MYNFCGAYQWRRILAVVTSIVIVVDRLSYTAPCLPLRIAICRWLVDIHLIFYDGSIPNRNTGRGEIGVFGSLVHGLVNFLRDMSLGDCTKVLAGVLRIWQMALGGIEEDCARLRHRRLLGCEAGRGVEAEAEESTYLVYLSLPEACRQNLSLKTS